MRDALAEARVVLADQADLGLAGVDVDQDCLRPRATSRARAQTDGAGPAAAHGAAPARAARQGPEGADGAQRAEHLAVVREALGPCTRCPLARTRRTIVFGDGDAEARLVLVGEGPGREEDATGRPFVGEAGRLLGRMLTAMGLQRDQVYIANVVKCRPPDNRFPQPEEVAACSPFLWRQLAAIRPQVVVALGRLASHTLLGTAAPMGRLRGSFAALAPPGVLSPPEAQALVDVPVMPTYHPAYLLRRPEDKRLVWQDLQAVMARLGLPAPAPAHR